MWKYHRSLCVPFSRTAAGLWIYHLFVWPDLNFLHNSKWITMPTQSYSLSVLICGIIIIIIIIILLQASFPPQRQLAGYQKSLHDSKSPQIPRTLLSILANVNQVVIWIVLIHVLFSILSVSFPVLSFGHRSQHNNSNWYHCHSHFLYTF